MKSGNSGEKQNSDAAKKKNLKWFVRDSKANIQGPL